MLHSTKWEIDVNSLQPGYIPVNMQNNRGNQSSRNQSCWIGIGILSLLCHQSCGTIHTTWGRDGLCYSASGNGNVVPNRVILVFYRTNVNHLVLNSPGITWYGTLNYMHQLNHWYEDGESRYFFGIYFFFLKMKARYRTSMYVLCVAQVWFYPIYRPTVKYLC